MLNRLLKVRAEQQLGTEGESEAIFGILPAPFQAHNKEYKITTQEDVLAISDSISTMIQLVLVAIAGISLLVGGIGIANVMLVTVSERTREIGVMKAVGAKNRHVAMAFLFEACVIGLLGGILGMAIAAAAAFTVVPLLFDVPGSLPLQWAGIAISICLAISLLSGLWPHPARLQHGPCRGSEERVRAYFYSGSHLSHYCRIASVDIVSYNS